MPVDATPSPKTYQDVKSNLRWYTAFASVPVALTIYFFIVPVVQRQRVEEFLTPIVSSKVIGVIGSGALVVGAFTLAAWFLIFVFEVHDKVYDRYVIRWRHFYDLDLILPSLTRPFGPNLDSRFFQQANGDMYAYMKPYYHFVADGAHDHKVNENLILRFYEAITKYWLTQINELLLLSALGITFAYFFIYKRLGLGLEHVSITTFVIVGCAILNRALRRLFLRPVRRATLDEIEDIHDRYRDELRDELKKLHDKFNLKWNA